MTSRSHLFEWEPSSIDDELRTCEIDPARQMILGLVKGGGPVLESGCGLGRWVKHLADKDVDVVGLEYVRDTIVASRRRWLGLPLVQGDAGVLPFQDDAFASVLSLGVVEHFIDGPGAPLREMFRVLRPGGRLLVTVPCLNALRRIKRIGTKSDGYARYPSKGEFFEYRLTPEEFRREVSRAGFVIESQEPIGSMDGVYHDLNPFGLLVKWQHGRFVVGRIGKAVNSVLSHYPYFHSHAQAIIARKGFAAGDDSAGRSGGRR